MTRVPDFYYLEYKLLLLTVVQIKEKFIFLGPGLVLHLNGLRAQAFQMIFCHVWGFVHTTEGRSISAFREEKGGR